MLVKPQPFGELIGSASAFRDQALAGGCPAWRPLELQAIRQLLLPHAPTSARKDRTELPFQDSLAADRARRRAARVESRDRRLLW